MCLYPFLHCIAHIIRQSNNEDKAFNYTKVILASSCPTVALHIEKQKQKNDNTMPISGKAWLFEQKRKQFLACQCSSIFNILREFYCVEILVEQVVCLKNHGFRRENYILYFSAFVTDTVRVKKTSTKVR